MATIGDLVVNFSANSRQFDRGARSVSGRLKSLASLALKVAGPLAAVFGAKAAIDGARTQLEAERKLESVIASTGQAAGLTAQQIKDYASELQGLTNFGDEATISAAAMLATFKQIRGNEFRETLAIAQDMAVVMGTDMESSIKQLGKALNDPASQMTALSRAGVQFNDTQKATIRNLQAQGDLVGAQRVILSELQSQFGGAAAAVADPWVQITNALGDVGEQVGFVIMDFLRAATGASDITGAIGKLGEAVAAVRPLAVSLGNAFRQTFDWILNALTDGGTVSSAIQGMIDLIERMVRGVRRLSHVAQALKSGHVFDLREEVIRLDNIAQQQKERERRRNLTYGPTMAQAGFDPNAVSRQAEQPVSSGAGFNLGAMFRQAGQEQAIGNAIGFMQNNLPTLMMDAMGQAGQMLGEVMTGRQEETRLAGALASGSQEAYSAIVRATRPDRTQERAAQQTATATERTANRMDELAADLGAFFRGTDVIGDFNS